MKRIVLLCSLLVPAALAQDGYMDETDCSVIAGWAWNGTNTPVTVDIYADWQPVTTAVANLFRQDLLNAGIGNGYHAFSIPTPSYLKDGNYHRINIEIEGTNFWLNQGSGGYMTGCSPNQAGGYQYYYSDTFASYNSSNWTQNSNGTLTFGSGLASSDANGGSLISKVSVPDGTSSYEVKMTLALQSSGGYYDTYLHATSNAEYGPTMQGTYYVVEVQTPSCSGNSCSAILQASKVISGTATTLSTANIPCHNMSVIRTVMESPGAIRVYVDGWPYIYVAAIGIATGQPGVGVRAAPVGNGIAEADLGPLDTMAPFNVSLQSVGTSAFPNRVELQWQPPADNPNGTGVAYYLISRTGGIGNPVSWNRSSEFVDTTVSPNTTYTYQITAYDFHDNASPAISVTVATPPAGAIDPRETGIRPMGNYWGGAGEQIDVRSGNLNYTFPLAKTLGRNGFSLPLSLTYNSQSWRQDPGGTWQLGHDVGYGYGWKMQFGALTPVYTGAYTVDHYDFVDSSGAEYRLDHNSSGVWSSVEGIYVWLDTTFNPARLYFRDGSFWTFGCTSSGTEQDAGTMYPTLIEDSNGNQIDIDYYNGANAIWPNSSARIRAVTDVRGSTTGQTYNFFYNGDSPVPHLKEITNTIGTAEAYTFTYGSIALQSPFSPFGQYGPWTSLQSVTTTGINTQTAFTYDSSGELTQSNLPYGGHLRWAYGPFTYVGTRTQQEVQTRYLAKDPGGSVETTYPFTRPAGDSNLTVHSQTTLQDPDGRGQKDWYFNTSGTYVGLLSSYMGSDRYTFADVSTGYTWTTNSSSLNPYVSQTSTTRTETTGNVTQKQTQTIDQYGNVTAFAIYDWGASTAARSWTNTYKSFSCYPPACYIYNRLATSTVTDGTKTVTLATNTYDGNTLQNITSGLINHDSAYGTSGPSRGNLTTSVTPSSTSNYSYDISGAVVSASDPYSHSVAVTNSSSANYAAPSLITPNSQSYLSTSMTWNLFLAPTSQTGPNGATSSMTYDAYGRVATATSPAGEVTTYTYANYSGTTGATVKAAITASGETAAQGNGRYSLTTYDGLGRALKVERHDSGGTLVSTVDTFYDSCGCSPLGKMKKTSMPYAFGGTEYWTVYNYDGMGRTISVVAADSSSTTSYTYGVSTASPQRTTTTIADPATHTKEYFSDGLGQLTEVMEDPGSSPHFSFETDYTYDALSHLIQVQQKRGTAPNQVTQTRTFNYLSGGNVTALLQSATNPENGTVSYTYNADNTLATRTDARNQRVAYTYDLFQRVTQIQRGSWNPSTQTFTPVAAQQTNFYFDTNPFNGNYTQAGWGRLAAVQYQAGSPHTFVEMYSYDVPGHAIGKQEQITYNCLWWYPGTNCNSAQVFTLTGSWTYDSEGRTASQTWPQDYGSVNPSVTYAYEVMGRPNTLTETSNTGANHIVTGATYNAADQPLSYAGSGESWTYNVLGQILTHQATPICCTGTSVNVTYNYGTAGQNNGQIASRTDNVSGEVVQYTYDALNRLIKAQTASNTWGQGFVYDGFGNLLQKNVTAGQAPPLQITVDSGNHITTATYDLAGNPTQMSLNGSYFNTAQPLTWDADERLVQVGTTGNWPLQYGYDAQNHRVWEAQSNMLGNGVFYFYGVDGHRMGAYTWDGTHTLLALNTNTGPEIYFRGRLMAVNSRNIGNQDQVGSINGGGGFPYGESYTSSSSTYDAVGFATYTSDSATGLDYALNRYYSSTWGRFLNPDPYRANGGGSGNVSDPQSWNRYAYAGGDPINRNDAAGTTYCFVNPATGAIEGCYDSVDVTDSGGSGGSDLPGGANGGAQHRMPQSSAKPKETGGARMYGPPSGIQFSGFMSAFNALALADCAKLIAGNTGVSATQLQTDLWNANVTAGTSQPGNTKVKFQTSPDGSYTYQYQTARTSGGNIELNGNYFPDPSQQNISLPDGGTASLVQLVNEALGSNMDGTQFGEFVFLHELSHIAGQPAQTVDTDDYNQKIIKKCIH